MKHQTVLLLLAALAGLPPSACAQPQAFSATGNEPGWRLDIAKGQLTLLTDYGATKTTVPAKVEAIPSGRRYVGSASGHSITAIVVDRVCHDTMTGMPRPFTVDVTLDRTALKGCGGDPAALLHGETWVVRGINGTDPVAGSRITLSFGPDGRLSGSSSCNAYNGTYALTGEGMTVGRTSVTRKGCASALMAQEATFLSILGDVRRFEMRPDATLVLHASDQRTITARR